MVLSDQEMRLSIFRWLDARVAELGEVLPRELLEQGMTIQGVRVPLVGPQGIFKPKVLSDGPISITTSPNSPYKDAVLGDDLIIYSYRGENAQHHENVGLRKALREAIPLVYFRGLVPGRYFAAWPVFVVADNPAGLTFTVQVDDIKSAPYALGVRPLADTGSTLRRSYVTAQVQRRVHQQAFRERVLDAYREQCAICRLRHRSLLDAAHIIGDKEETGEPLVENGLSLCKLHHAAFDQHYFGIRPDRTIDVRPSILEESDGPMLQHGLKEIHCTKIHVPNSKTFRPDVERLAARYERYLSSI